VTVTTVLALATFGDTTQNRTKHIRDMKAKARRSITLTKFSLEPLDVVLFGGSLE
jgi:hypothetical protein